MNIEETRKQVAEVIYKVINEDIEASNIIRQHPDLWRVKDESIGCVLHALGHYETDSDIREKDEGYAEMQTNALKAMADQLSRGLPLTDKHGYW